MERNLLLDELLGRYQARVWLWCLRFSGDRDLSSDLAQEVLINAWRRLDGFRGDSKFSTWLYVLARNHCTNALRSHCARPDHLAEVLPADLPDGAAESTLRALEREVMVSAMEELMAENLDETERQVFLLRYGEELPLSAIARKLKLENPSGAKAYLVSARRKLDRAIRRWMARAHK